MPAPLRILFVGNSYTNRNDLPGLIAGLFAAGDPPQTVEAEKVLANGASLRQHWNAGTAARLMRGRDWDWVVLQEQSTLPIKNRQRYHENVRLFTERVPESGARLALYETWARRDAPESQEVLTEAVREIAREMGAEVVPVGLAWRQVQHLDGAPELFDKDGSHPTAAGSYLAACVFYGVLGRRSPEGAPAPAALRLSDAEVRLLQRAAREAVGL